MTEVTLEHPVCVSVGAYTKDKKWQRWEGDVGAFFDAYFSRHMPGPKDGPCITQGPLVGPERASANIQENTVIILDFDNGIDLDTLQNKLEEAGLGAIIWTTHSHLKTESEISQSALDKFIDAENLDDHDLIAAAQRYLATKKKVAASVVESVHDVALVHREGGAKYVVSHEPMQRWKVLCFLAEPFKFVLPGAKQKDRIDEWKRRYIGFAERFGADTADTKCSDPARLQYLPRYASGTDPEDHFITSVEGRCVGLDDMPYHQTARERQAAARSEIGSLTADLQTGPARSENAPADAVVYQTPGLGRFLGKYGKGFLAKDWLASVVEPRNVVDDSKTEFECPLDHMHSNAGDANDRAFFATNAEPLSEPPVHWTMFCGHATCSDHTKSDRAQYLDAACVKYGITSAEELEEFVDTAFAEEANAGPQFTTGRGGDPRPTDPHNCNEVMRVEDIRVTYDLFTDQAMISGLARENGPLNDHSVREFRAICNDKYDFYPSKDLAWDVLLEAGRAEYIDTQRNYIKLLPKWDNVPRIETFLIDYAGAEDTELNREFTKVFFLGLVHRALNPGCQFDNVLILEGPQGIGKSTVLRTLVPNEDWFCDSGSAKDDIKVLLEKTKGKWLVEIPEFAGMKFAEIEHVKATLTRRVDESRMAYDRAATSRPRRFIFAITTNRQDYLRDTSGNRRFMPVWCSKNIPIEKVASIRDQLYAEAVALVQQGALPNVNPKLWAAAAEVQSARLEENEYAAKLEPAFKGKAGRVKCADVYEWLGLNAGASSLQFKQKRVTECMETFGYAKRQSNWGDSVLKTFVRVPTDWTAKGGKGGGYVNSAGAEVVLPQFVLGVQGWTGGLHTTPDGASAGVVEVISERPSGLLDKGR
ncbi:MAG: VapE domain-containing protein [Burkholderiaceae bacterium]